MYEAIPDQLRKLKQWGLFRLERRGKKVTKIPIDPHTGKSGKSNDSSTWGTFEQALDSVKKYNCHGLGFYFAPPYVGIDLDNVREEIDRFLSGDHDENIVSEFVEMLGSYSEISVSGNGLHIILRGELPEGGRRKGNVEMYSEGRFFAMTGNVLKGFEDVSEDLQGCLSYLHSKYIGSSKKEPMPQQNNSVDLSEDRIIEIASNSKNGMRFNVFMSGGWEQFYDSHSEADMAFCNDLAFWCARDFHKMDSIFRRSSLYREKWDEPRKNSTYGADTLNKAIQECARVFTLRDQGEENPLIVIDQEIEEIKQSYYSFDDTGNASRFVDAYGDIVRYNYQTGTWFFYDGKTWRKDHIGHVKSLVDRVVENMKKERLYIPDDADPEEVKKQFQKHIKTSRGSRAKTYMLRESEHLVSILLESFDADINLFNINNGYVNLKNGQLHPHEREKYFSKISNVSLDFRKDCSRWKAFLHDIFAGDQELIEYIQRAIGYTMIGNTAEQKMFILYGNGRNGKSVFLDIITSIFGDYSINIQPQSLMYNPYKSGASSDIARLEGARLVTSTESNDGLRLDEGLIKQLTGGDKITARYMYQGEFEYIPQFTLWMATNHKPIITGTDDGIWRRLSLIPFNVQIPKNKVDKALKYKLKKEANAILRWMIEGCLKWQKYGLNEPDAVKNEKENYRSEMNILERFLEDRCVRTVGKSVEAYVMYQAYKRWASDNNQTIYSSTKFGREMSKILEKEKNRQSFLYKCATFERSRASFFKII